MAHVPSFRRQPIVFLTAATFNRRHNDQPHGILRGIWERSVEPLVCWRLRSDAGPLTLPRTAWVQCRPVARLGKAWKSVSARQIMKALGMGAPLWQDDYFDRYLRSTESYAQKWEYVRNNLLRAGLVHRPEEDWPYQGRISIWNCSP